MGRGAYGFERDELYFRMLRPAWDYVDQPPLTPCSRVPANIFAGELRRR